MKQIFITMVTSLLFVGLQAHAVVIEECHFSEKSVKNGKPDEAPADLTVDDGRDGGISVATLIIDSELKFVSDQFLQKKLNRLELEKVLREQNLNQMLKSLGLKVNKADSALMTSIDAEKFHDEKSGVIVINFFNKQGESQNKVIFYPAGAAVCEN